MVNKAEFKKKNILIAIIFLLIVGVSIFIMSSVLKPKQKSRAAIELKGENKTAESSQKEPDTLDHLKISKIGVDAKVVPVGITKEGNMDVPASIYDVGWYTKGAKPGTKGTAVFAGHLDSASGEAGVFASLNKLAVGDIIKFVKPDGKETSFKVTKTKVYGSTDKPSEVFKSTSGTHLNLITCTGSWDKNKSQYDKRLVVFTDLVN